MSYLIPARQVTASSSNYDSPGQSPSFPREKKSSPPHTGTSPLLNSNRVAISFLFSRSTPSRTSLPPPPPLAPPLQSPRSSAPDLFPHSPHGAFLPPPELPRHHRRRSDDRSQRRGGRDGAAAEQRGPAVPVLAGGGGGGGGVPAAAQQRHPAAQHHPGLRRQVHSLCRPRWPDLRPVQADMVFLFFFLPLSFLGTREGPI